MSLWSVIKLSIVALLSIVVEQHLIRFTHSREGEAFTAGTLYTEQMIALVFMR